MNLHKKVPCEECRNQKRRCNGNHPCERCGRLDLACIYLKNSTPDDVEFIQLAKEAALCEQVAFLEDQLDEMNTAVETLRRQQHLQQQQTANSTPSMTSDDCSSIASSDNTTSPMNDYQLTTIEQPSPSAVWTLEVTKGSLCFKTQVQTHSDLLFYAQNLTQVIQLNDAIPFGVPKDPNRCVLMQSMGVRLLYKNNKTRYKNMLLILENLAATWKSGHRRIENGNGLLLTTIPFAAPSLATTLALVLAYVECPHFYHWAIGIPTFYRLFIQPLMDETQILSVSPAVYAFCAVICTMDCDHVSKVLSPSLLTYYGQYYYEQARLSLTDRFDDTSLELVTAYVFMAVYHWNLSQESKSIRYADMAQRMAHLVLELEFGDQNYLDNNDSYDDTVHFYRVIEYLKQTCVYEKSPLTRQYRQNLDWYTILDKLRKRLASFSNNNKNTNHSIPPGLTATRLLQDEPKFLRYHAQHRNLQDLIQKGHGHYDRTSDNFYDVLRQVNHHLKCSIDQWYAALETDLKIPGLPLWEATSVTDHDYMAALEQKCTNNIVPVLMTLALYQELIIHGLGSLPKNPRSKDDVVIVQQLSDFWLGGNEISQAAAQELGVTNMDKWKHRIKKMNEIKDEIQFEGTNEEFVSLIREAFYKNTTRYEYPILVTVFQSTLNAIRICQYLQQQRWKGAGCYFDKRVVYSAKFMLHRFSIAGDDLPSSISQHGYLIQEKMDLCDDLLREDDDDCGYLQFDNEQDSLMAS